MTDPYDEFQSSFKNIAPKRLFLSPTDEDDAEVVDLSDCVWSEDRVCDADVEYIRADLAAPAEPDHLPPHLLPFTDQTCWQQRDDLVREVLDLLEKNKALEASIRQVAETRDIHFRRVQELETAARRPTPSLRPVDLDDYDKDRDPMGWFNG